MSKKDNPCYGCPDRTMTCHGDCEKYAQKQARDEERKKRISEARRKEYGVYSEYVRSRKK